MNKIISVIAVLLALMPSTMQAQRLVQPLSRSVVAVNRSGSTIRSSVTSAGGQGSLISWRKLAQEPEGTTYNVYRRSAGASNYTKLNSKPLTKTNYTPTSLVANAEYAVTAITPDGVEGEMSAPFIYKTQAYPNVWFNFDFDNTVITSNDYRTKFVWPMDLDGNGEVDAIVVDRLYAGAASSDDAENASDNTADVSHKIQAYKLDGTLMWTVDMGPNVNICGGQNDMVVAWDINCDGRCEVIIKSSDGTRFWDKQNETWGKYAKGSDVADVDGDGIVDYRTQTSRNRPFYVSVIDGATGEEIACNELKYDEVSDGTDRYTRDNRSDYMSDGYAAMDGHFAICYLDGIHPSLVMECLDRETNKTHHNYVFTWDYDWSSGIPTNWHHSATWSRNDKTPWPAEFHQLRVADVNGDGCDEMIQGGYSVNPLKGWFCSPGIGHGDRYILSDIDPDRPGLEVYAIQQSALLGQLIYDANTAERIKEWYLPSVYDVGRGACMDIDASRKGYELYSFTDDYIYDCKGEKTDYTRSGCGIKQMFEGVWWDGNLQREELSSPGGSNYGTNLMITQVLNKSRLVEFSQESSWATHAANGTRPAFMGDITGDWREEVILAKQNDSGSTGLVGYTTAMPTDYSIYCLQQDPHYRGDCTTRGYYQHPNTGFYLGSDMPLPPLPPVFDTDLRWKGGTVDNGFTSFDMTTAAAYADGKSLMFDLSGSNASDIALGTGRKPSAVFLMNPLGHDYTFSGAFTGDMTLTKSMQGKATFNEGLAHTGQTIISEGTLCVNGTVAGPVELRAKGTLCGDMTLKDTVTFEGALNYEGCRLMPAGLTGVMAFDKAVTLPGDVYIEIEADNGKCGKLAVDGSLTFKNTNYITVNLLSQNTADYLLAECTGTLTCNVESLKCRGLEGINYDLLTVDDKQLILRINGSRDAAENVLWTGAESNTWNYKADNFSLNAEATPYVAGDQAVFDNTAAQTTINVPEMMVTNGIVFNSGKYTLSGEGGISGEGSVTVNNGADVTLNMKNSDYTGATIVNGGTLTVPNFYDGGQKSAIGAAEAAQGNLVLNRGKLVLSKDNMGTDRQITLTDTATISIAQANSSLSLKGNVSGTGYLVKDGAGQLNFTYGGANNFAGVILKQGIIAQGAWNSTFGKSGSPMVLAGGEVHQIDINSTSTVPEFNHAVTVEAGTTNKIIGSSRGRINGTVKGSGALTIVSKYVRCDVGATFADYSGELTLSGSQFRLMSNVTDMSKARVIIDAATNVGHYKGGSGNAVTATTKIGSLSSAKTATDGILGGSASTYEVGYLNDNSDFYGLLQCARMVKVGNGMLSLHTAGHSAPMTINGGTLSLSGPSAAVMTTGAVTIANGGTLTATGEQGIGSDLTLNKGARLLCQLTATSNSILSVSGSVNHNGDTIVVKVPAGRKLEVGDEITVFTSTGAHTGNFFVKSEADGITYEFDSSTFLSDGKLRVTSVATGIARLKADGTHVDVYSSDGIKIRHNVIVSEALNDLPEGIYIIGNQKVVKK